MAQAPKTQVLKASANAFEIIPLTEPAKWLNMLIYGAFGSGKTTLAGSAADVESMADVLLIDIESGTMSIQDSDQIKHKDRIDRVRISSFKQLAKIHEFLKAHCRYRDMPESEDKLKALEAKFKGCTPEDIKVPRRYNTVIIDSLSELDTLCLYELLGLSTDMKLDDALSDGDMATAQFAEYKKNNQILQLIIRAYRDLPINAIMVCHAAYTQDEQKRMFFAPGLTGKLSGQVQGFVDIVGYLKVGTKTDEQREAPRRLYVQPIGKFDAKNRKASYKEAYFDNPDMTSMAKALGLGK